MLFRSKSITYHIPQAEIVAISDIYVDGAKKVAGELGIPNYYEDYHEILNNPEITAVLICSSTDTHADIAIEAAKAGKHIFCEKPVDLTVEKIKAVIAAVDEAGVKLQIGFNRRYDHNFAQIKNLANEGKIGELQTIKITSRDPAEPLNPAPSLRRGSPVRSARRKANRSAPTSSGACGPRANRDNRPGAGCPPPPRGTGSDPADKF